MVGELTGALWGVAQVGRVVEGDWFGEAALLSDDHLQVIPAAAAAV